MKIYTGKSLLAGGITSQTPERKNYLPFHSAIFGAINIEMNFDEMQRLKINLEKLIKISCPHNNRGAINCGFYMCLDCGEKIKI